MIKAKNKDILKKLKDVDKEVLNDFDETADILIRENRGDAKEALKIALAYCSGHYKQTLPTSSLLTGKIGFCTIKMNVEKGQVLDQSSALSIIQKYWAPRIASSIRVIKSLRDGSGVCFDLRTIDAEGFMENYEHMKAKDARRVDFECARIKQLPSDLEGDGGHFSHGGGSG